MLFVIEAMDKAGALEVRMQSRPAHVEFLKSLGDVLVLAGPFLDDDEKPCGSLVVIKAENLDAAKAIAARDPYAAAGLFESSEVRRWSWTLNAPEGI